MLGLLHLDRDPTPVRIQRADAMRAKLAELNLTEQDVSDAVAWAVQWACNVRRNQASRLSNVASDIVDTRGNPNNELKDDGVNNHNYVAGLQIVRQLARSSARISAARRIGTPVLPSRARQTSGIIEAQIALGHVG